MQIFSVILLSLCILIVVLYSLRTNNNILKFDKIFQNHFKLLKEDKFSLIVFIVVPIIAAVSCANLKCITIDIINNINTALVALPKILFLHKIFGSAIKAAFRPRYDTGGACLTDGYPSLNNLCYVR